MTHLVDAPRRFADDALRGFVEAYPALVRAVDGGVVRAVPGAAGKAAVVVGGGSGHYPAFAGFVGPGFADGAVAGHVFTSPSVGRIHSVARAASLGGGVLLACGNYAGDELNFSLAAERLESEGIPTRLLLVTDDIASAPEDERERRRGVAGGMVVFKIAAAAAESGAPLPDVVRIAGAANAATRTLGVAFGGCTLPGESEPLFEVASGRMAVGLGIHGEPGISEAELPPSRELGRMLVDRVLPDHDVRGRTAAVVLNGLGSTKQEELFVLWHTVVDGLRARGVRVVAPEVRELVTSLDMAGCSLTVTWLDDELEPLWLAPCHTPALSRFGAVTGLAAVEATDVAAAGTPSTVVEQETPAPRGSDRDPVSALLVDAAQRVADALVEHEGELGRLDAVAGDGDHGVAMVRGSSAALAVLRSSALSPAKALGAAAAAWGEEAGGTSGVLWSRAIDVLADVALGDGAPPAAAARAAVDAVAALGHASPGDKTMLDAMVPFVTELTQRVAAGDPLPSALDAAAEAAADGARSTAGLRPRVGRARPLAERSVGHQDPGATSFAIVARAIAESVVGR